MWAVSYTHLDVYKRQVTARVLAAAVKQLDDVSLVLCGEGSADRYAQQVGVQLGELLGLPTVNAVSSIELDDLSLIHI